MKLLILRQSGESLALPSYALGGPTGQPGRLNTAGSLASEFERTCRGHAAKPALIDGCQAFSYHWLHQAALCLHRDLEGMLAQVNAIHVAEVRLELDSVEPVPALEPGRRLWNPTHFGSDCKVPPHILLPAAWPPVPMV